MVFGCVVLMVTSLRSALVGVDSVSPGGIVRARGSPGPPPGGDRRGAPLVSTRGADQGLSRARRQLRHADVGPGPGPARPAARLARRGSRAARPAAGVRR